MKQTVIFLAAFVVAIVLIKPAEASGRFGGASSSAVAKAMAQQNQRQHQQQNQLQNQFQGQLNNQGINNVGNTVFAGRKNLRNAPGIGLPFMAPTAICQGTASIGGSFWLGGIAGATTFSIDLCMQMETIRVGIAMMQNAVTHDHQVELQNANKEIYCITKWGKPTKMCSPLETHPSPPDRAMDLDLDLDLELETSQADMLTWNRSN